MWYLESFDKENESFVEQFPLQNMTTEIVKHILEVDDEDCELPVAVRENDVPLSKAPKFAPYISEPFDVDENCEYFVGFSAD